MGSPAVETANVGGVVLMEMLSNVATEFGGLAESVALTMIGEIPAADGVPAMAPVRGSRVRPAGSVPEARLQVIVPVPPLECKTVLYAAFKTPSGSVVVLIISCRAKRKGEFVAAVNLPVPSPRRIEMESSPSLATAKSWCPSPLKSPVVIAVGLKPTGIGTGFWNVPSQLLRSTFTTFASGSLATKSWHPLAVNVAEAIPGGVAGAALRGVPSVMGEPEAWENVP